MSNSETGGRAWTAKQASEHAGKSITWLRTHFCQWCDQSALNGIRYGCGAFGIKCEPRKRKYISQKLEESKDDR